jgi:hypothetical protein
MFNKLDQDHSGLVDRLELMSELHSNPEFAELFSLKSLVTDEGFVDKFSQMYSKVAVRTQFPYLNSTTSSMTADL